MKLRLYLDTSVFSAYHDDRVPERQAQTLEFWERRGDVEVCTSELAGEEIAQTPDRGKRERLESLLAGLTIHPLTDEMRVLADRYIGADVFTVGMVNDALHVAAAVLTRQDILVSWNFKHLVNRRRRAEVNQVNVREGLPSIEILAPPEI